MKPAEMKKKREKLKLTQGQLAENLGYSSYHSISEMENGKRKIPKIVAKAIDAMIGTMIGKSK